MERSPLQITTTFASVKKHAATAHTGQRLLVNHLIDVTCGGLNKVCSPRAVAEIFLQQNAIHTNKNISHSLTVPERRRIISNSVCRSEIFQSQGGRKQLCSEHFGILSLSGLPNDYLFYSGWWYLFPPMLVHMTARHQAFHMMCGCIKIACLETPDPQIIPRITFPYNLDGGGNQYLQIVIFFAELFVSK